MAARILVIDDDSIMIALYRSALGSCGHKVRVAERGDVGLKIAQQEDFDVILTDFMMPGLDGLDLLQEIHRVKPFVPIILLTGKGSADVAIEAMKRGAYDYLLKPVQLGELIEVVQKAVANSQMQGGVVSLEENGKRGPTLIGSSAAMQQVFKEVGRVAAKPVTVLIRGETGTGKELVAQAIYQHGDRNEKPFVVVNCAAIPETLLESELFGSEKGAFTGAQARRIGRFEQAHQGTLFLDEIGELSPGTQSKLLRALQEKVIQRLGSNETIPVDVRVLAATHRNLEEAIRERQFREDLYYRLSDATIKLPPLRERREDIPEIVAHFIAHHSQDLAVQQPGITADALDYIQGLEWPGNVRQLQSFIRQAIIASRGYAISLETVKALRQREAEAQTGGENTQAPFREYITQILDRASLEKEPRAYALVMEAAEKELLTQTIARAKGNQSLAARWLGISRLTLRGKLTDLGLRTETPKENGAE